jgi:AcrR family transcriptional regulator
MKFIRLSVPPTPSSSLRRLPRQERSRALIERILDGADRLLVEEGSEALTTTRIAETAGVAVGSLYRYFPDRASVVEALARRHMESSEELMAELAERARYEAWDDPVGEMIDAYADRYRREPGYRTLWFGRNLTEELREADLANKRVLAERLREVMLAATPVRDDSRLATACRAAVFVADALLQEAFRADPDGDPALLGEAKRILRGYLGELTVSYAKGAA